MQVVTYNEILTSLCDNFDSLISPKIMSRSNTNVLYLVFKAIAKGYEVINNICVTLSNKFDPAKCSDEDLVSIAKLVGTERLSGSASGLYITATNNTGTDITLSTGVYYYSLDTDTRFVFEVLEDTVIRADGGTVSFIAMTEEVGSYSVTAQSSITIESDDEEIPADLTFSCTDNSSLLGTAAETILEFRKRVNTDPTRQNSVVELETELKNLPYLFDASVRFNNSLQEEVYDGITIPSYYMAIFYSGSPRTEIAEIVAKKSIFPTVATDDSVEVVYTNNVFVDGNYKVNLIPLKKYEFTVEVGYKINTSYISKTSAQTKIKTALQNALNTQVHTDYISESEIYTIIANLNLVGLTLLNVDILVNNVSVDYLSIPKSRIPYLADVTFEELA